MTRNTAADDRRAQHVALLGFMLQLVAFILLLGLSLWQDSHILAALSRFVLVGVPIWFVLYVVISQVHRVGVEALETQELRRAREAGASESIFELDDEALLLEQSRLKWMVTWLLPACTVLVSILLLAGHFALWGWSLDEAFDTSVLKRTAQPTLMMWFVVGVGFLCFLYARYALALARLPGWGLLHSGAVCQAGTALACVLVAIALMASGTIAWAEPLVAYVIRAGMIVLGLELSANFVLDLYRPRTPGELPRPSFDSRLLGVFAEPGGIAKSIAEAMNYQFGFQVSSTWFYQLLQRWLFPITVLALVAVVMLTSVVVVDADEQAVIERFGRLVNEEKPVLSAGLHFKWPYPIDIVRRASAKRISELVIGEATEEDKDHVNQPIIWTEAHEFVPELTLLVASPKLEKLSEAPDPAMLGARKGKATESVPVSLLMVSVPIEYRIKDLPKYLYTYADPGKLMEAVAYRYLSDYAAGVDIDELIGPGRESFNRDLKRILQERLDELGVGIEIAFCGLRGAHPPAKEKVAAAFQSVVSSQTSMAATIHAAEGEARKRLTSLAGTEARAIALDEAIQARDALPPDSPAAAEAKRRVEELLMGNPEKGIAPVSGKASALIAEANAEASRRVSEAAAMAVTFGTQVAAAQAAPGLYEHRKWLEVFKDLGKTRKYLIVGDRSNVVIEYETAREAGLDQVLSEGVERERKKRNP